VRVVKVGGSLFQWAGLRESLIGWLAAQSPAANVLVAGGGQLADVIREADARFALGQEASHWLCVEVLGVTARLLSKVLRQSRLAVTLEEARQLVSLAAPDQPIVFCPVRFLREVEFQLDAHPLPHTWDATSDSIAARVAVALRAEELVLLKSAEPPENKETSGDYVDACFPQAAKGLSQVRFVNLRQFAERSLPFTGP
jgi:aspartokinase-like uncharacterized kinase